jgi:hypothetical protein
MPQQAQRFLISQPPDIGEAQSELHQLNQLAVQCRGRLRDRSA